MTDDVYEDEYSLCATVTDGRRYLAMVHHRVAAWPVNATARTVDPTRSASIRWRWACATCSTRGRPGLEPRGRWLLSRRVVAAQPGVGQRAQTGMGPQSADGRLGDGSIDHIQRLEAEGPDVGIVVVER